MLNSTDLRYRGPRRPVHSEQRPVSGSSPSQQPIQAPDQKPEQVNRSSGRGGKSKKVIAISVFATLLVAGSLGVAGFFAWKYFSGSPDASSEKEEVAAETTNRVIEKTAMLFELPKDEEPTVAQIQDKSKLKDQDFFDKAQDGDYLLVYEEAKVALIYRESIGKLINVGPVSLPQGGESQQNTQGSVSGESTP